MLRSGQSPIADYYYIKNQNGDYYRNIDFSQFPQELIWVEDKSEATLCSQDRATVLISYWGLQDTAQLEPLTINPSSQQLAKPKNLERPSKQKT